MHRQCETLVYGNGGVTVAANGSMGASRASRLTLIRATVRIGLGTTQQYKRASKDCMSAFNRHNCATTANHYR